jgi:hypothetical protein
MSYQLEKRIWTDADFEEMSWHDNSIYKFRLNGDLEFDIDYILKWNEPDEILKTFTFWIAPSTLVFKQPHSLQFDFDSVENGLEIATIERKVIGENTQWTIIAHEAIISFCSEGYTQYIRQEPFFAYDQCINFEERDGYSLERTTNQQNLKRNSAEVLMRKQKESADYEVAKKYKAILNEKEALEKLKEKGEISLKQYLLKNNELKEQISKCRETLIGSSFEIYLTSYFQ